MRWFGQSFQFAKPGRLIDRELELILDEKEPPDPQNGRVPTYHFVMQRVGEWREIGRIDLRIGNSEDLERYSGHIGYGVNRAYRGHRYAARSCRLLLPLAKHHGLDPLWITCNPDNYASRRTCEILGARLIEIVDLPVGHEMYLEGERQKCRYRLDLKDVRPLR